MLLHTVQQLGTADVEIKVSAAENPELPKVPRLKPGAGQTTALYVLEA